MADDRPFLHAIAAAPADDGPRLAFADWLDEHGDAARAEFIRVQCALAGLADDDLRRWPLRSRASALLAAHGAAWRRPLDGLPLFNVTFERGLPDGVLLRQSDFTRHAAALFARAPSVRRLWVIARGEAELRALAATPELNRLDTLILAGGQRITRDGLRALLEAPALARLAAFGIEASGLMPDALDALPACGPALPPLRTLRVESNGYGNGLATAVAAATGLTELTHLHLPNTFIGHRGVRALAGAPHLAGLHALDLFHNPIDERGAAEIGAETSSLRRVRSLGLKRGRIGDVGAAALAITPHLTDLRRLDLRDNGITDAGAFALARSPYLGALHRLDLANVDPLTADQTNHVGPGARRALVERFGSAVRF